MTTQVFILLGLFHILHAIHVMPPVGTVSRDKTAEIDNEEETSNVTWDAQARATGWVIFGQNSALTSGAVAMKTALDRLTDTLSGAYFTPEEANALKDLAAREDSTATAGVRINTVEHATNDEGTYYISLVQPGCKTKNEYGDTDCETKWGDELTVGGTVFVGKPLEEGSTFTVNVKTEFVGSMFKNPEDVFVECHTCGRPCTFKLGMKTYKIETDVCPLKKGPFTFFKKTFNLPSSLLARSFQFKETMHFKLKHKDSSVMTDVVTKIETFAASGHGGGWKAEAEAAEWEPQAMQSGWVLHGENTALTSGAFAMKTALDRLTDTLSGAYFTPEEVSALTASAAREDSTATAGVKISTVEHATNDEGTYYISLVEPGCKTKNEFGDTDCEIKWGNEMTVGGTVYVGTPLEDGSTFTVNVRTEFVKSMFKDPEDVFVECHTCGRPCTFKLGMKTYKIETDKCPLKKGPFTFFKKHFKLPSSLLARSFQFKETLHFQLKHKNSSVMTDVVTKVETFAATGHGGGWKAEDEEAEEEHGERESGPIV